MASPYYLKLTNLGLTALANAPATGQIVEITHIAVGSGGAVHGQSDTLLQAEEWRGSVTNVGVSSTDSRIIEAEGLIPPNVGGFYIREIGLFDADGNMFAVGNLPESDKPLLADGVALDYLILATINVGNTANIELSVEPSLSFATKTWVYDQVNTPTLLATQALLLAMTEKQHRINAETI